MGFGMFCREMSPQYEPGLASKGRSLIAPSSKLGKRERGGGEVSGVWEEENEGGRGSEEARK
jgi:hypothetical protein